MNGTKLNWVTSVSGGQFTYTPDGKTIREIAGAWFIFDQDDTFVARFDTRGEAVANAGGSR